jgi:hypothetical protein
MRAESVGLRIERPAARRDARFLMSGLHLTTGIDDKSYVVSPKSLQTREPVLPLPESSRYAER